MRLLGEILAACLIGAVVLILAGFGPDSARKALSPVAFSPALQPNSPAPPSRSNLPHPTSGELRCEGRGAIIITVDGRDYAVNGMASSRYPPVQQVWNSESHPETDIDRLIAQGLTLCAW